MADKLAISRYQHYYRQLLRLYPKAYRERFGEGMEQTFNDLCRERLGSGKGLVSFALWTFFETSTALVRETATNIVRRTMNQDSTHFLKLLTYSAITLSALMVAGIVTLMLLARGTGEDITGIVAPALLITFASSVVATVAAVVQKKAHKTIAMKPEDDRTRL